MARRPRRWRHRDRWLGRLRRLGKIPAGRVGGQRIPAGRGDRFRRDGRVGHGEGSVSGGRHGLLAGDDRSRAVVLATAAVQQVERGDDQREPEQAPAAVPVAAEPATAEHPADADHRQNPQDDGERGRNRRPSASDEAFGRGRFVAVVRQEQPAQQIERHAEATEDRRRHQRDADHDRVEAVPVADPRRDTRDLAARVRPPGPADPEVLDGLLEAGHHARLPGPRLARTTHSPKHAGPGAAGHPGTSLTFPGSGARVPDAHV